LPSSGCIVTKLDLRCLDLGGRRQVELLSVQRCEPDAEVSAGDEVDAAEVRSTSRQAVLFGSPDHHNGTDTDGVSGRAMTSSALGFEQRASNGVGTGSSAVGG
jgi:hypothetical protein